MALGWCDHVSARKFEHHYRCSTQIILRLLSIRADLASERIRKLGTSNSMPLYHKLWQHCHQDRNLLVSVRLMLIPLIGSRVLHAPPS